ncbi:MAG: DNA translocase FtsK 4TM domain-containing protein, partial [Clostridia bacterium]|nr:DNA translocase FtsK 4TM domain-containing protein [Clostridia bacterium]
MATAKRRKVAKKSAPNKSVQKEVATAKRQLTSVVLFGLGVFLMAVVFIPGENFWNVMQNFFFGIFGVLTYIFPLFLILIAVLSALDKLNARILTRTKLSFFVGVLVLSAVDIFTADKPLLPFFKHLGEAYKDGAGSGGFIGALIGHPIAAAFGRTGAAITVIILIFVLLMIITGTTIIALFKSIAKPVKKIEESAQAAYKERAERKINTDIDLPVDDAIMPVREKITTQTIAEKKKKLISSYLDEDIPDEEITEESSVGIDTAISAAKKEATADDSAKNSSEK